MVAPAGRPRLKRRDRQLRILGQSPLEHRRHRQPGRDGERRRLRVRRRGHRVVATVAGRSERTAGLAAQAGLELVPDLDAVVGGVGARALDRAARRGRRDRRRRSPRLRAGPARAARVRLERRLAGNRARGRTVLADAGLELVDGSISGGPPRADYTTRVYLSGPGRPRRSPPRAPPWLDARVVGGRGRARLGGEDVHRVDVQGLDGAARARAPDRARARRAAAGARRPARLLPGQIDRAARSIAVSTTKSARYVGEMREIAATQGGAGLTPALFEAMAEVYAALRDVRARRRGAGGRRTGAGPRGRARPSTSALVLNSREAKRPQGLGASGICSADSFTLRKREQHGAGREDLNLHEPKPTGT